MCDLTKSKVLHKTVHCAIFQSLAKMSFAAMVKQILKYGSCVNLGGLMSSILKTMLVIIYPQNWNEMFAIEL